MIFWMQYRYVTKYIVKGKIFTSPKFPGFCDSNYPKLFIWGHFPWIGHHGRTRGITDREPLLLSDYFYYKFTLRFLTQSFRIQDDVPVHRQESVWQKNIYYKWFIWEKSVHVQMQLINELPNFHRQIRTLHLRFSGENMNSFTQMSTRPHIPKVFYWSSPHPHRFCPLFLTAGILIHVQGLWAPVKTSTKTDLSLPQKRLFLHV